MSVLIAQFMSIKFQIVSIRHNLHIKMINVPILCSRWRDLINNFLSLCCSHILKTSDQATFPQRMGFCPQKYHFLLLIVLGTFQHLCSRTGWVMFTQDFQDICTQLQLKMVPMVKMGRIHLEFVELSSCTWT